MPAVDHRRLQPRRGVARRRVRQLSTARVVSVGGTQAAQVALVFQIYSLTRSGLWVLAALLSLMSVGGLLAPLSGFVADRFDRRRVMTISELLGGATYLLLSFAHAPELLLAGAFVASAFGAPFRPASAAAIPNLVPPEELPWANAQLATGANIAQLAGPILGGALVAVSGARLVFAIDAATFLVSAALIALTKGSFGGRAPSSRHDESPGGALAGFCRLASDRRLGSLAVARAFAYGAFGAALVLDPALVDHFHAGSVGYGLLTAIWGGGAVVGAIIAGRTVPVSRAPVAVVWGMAAMAVSLGSIAVLPSFPLIVAAGALGGAGSGFVFVPWILLLQHYVEDAMRGRVLAASGAFEQVAFPAGMGCAASMLALVDHPQRSYALAGGLVLLGLCVAVRTMTAWKPEG